MALAQRLDLRQSQTLAMTPQLQQAIALLQLSNLDLSDYIERELEENPLLERVGDTDAPAEAEAAAPLGTDADTDRSAELDIRTDDVWSDASLGSGADGWADVGRGGRQDFSGDDNDITERMSEAPTLRQHIVDQIRLELAGARERLIAMLLLDGLGDAGWYSGDTAALAQRLGCPQTEVDAVLARLQRFDPPGIFATCLAGCLEAQLRERGAVTPAMALLLKHLDRLGQGDLAGLCRLTRTGPDELRALIAQLRSCNPKPGAGFDSAPAAAIVPDVYLRMAPDGTFYVELNADSLPEIAVDTATLRRASAAVSSAEERSYLQGRHASAGWLLRALQQRAQTVTKVATQIAEKQEAFFRLGVAHLKPMVLREIAEAIGMHESTVSRVTSNKYIATPRGLFELKYFFTGAIQTAGGGDTVSAEAVRHRIRQLIEAEAGPADVLSDDRLVTLLKEGGVDIARRTVAKYREAMGIGSSSERRRRLALRG